MAVIFEMTVTRERSKMKTTIRRNLYTLVFSLLVVMLVFGMVIPVFPFLTDKLGAIGGA